MEERKYFLFLGGQSRGRVVERRDERDVGVVDVIIYQGQRLGVAGGVGGTHLVVR